MFIDQELRSNGEHSTLELPKKFKKWLKPKRFKIAYGGRGSSKSWSIARLLIALSLTKQLNILCVREFQISIKDSSHRLLKNQIHKLGVDHLFDTKNNQITCLLTGSTFIFKGIRINPDSLRSLEGIDICWVEEAQTLSQSSLDILIPTIRADDSEIWFSLNPVRKKDPVYKRFIDPIINPDSAHKPDPEAFVIKVNYKNNPWFSKVMRTEMVKCREEDYEAYEHIWLGKCLRISKALIYKKMVVSEFTSPSEKSVDYCHGLDFGYAADPTAGIRCFVDTENNLFIDYEAYGYHVPNENLPTFLKEAIPTMGRGYSVYADCADPRTINYLSKRGIGTVGVTKGEGSVNEGIKFIQSFRRIVVHPRCVNTIKEFREYKWKTDRITGDILPIAIDKNNHAMDALRYALSKYIENAGNLELWEKLGKQTNT